MDRTGWSTNTCGTAQATIELRIADCAAHGTIGPGATWDGSTKGQAGQGLWKLVARTGDVASSVGKEVWQDTQTGLLWSSKLTPTGTNWCKASGSNFITNNPSAEDDPNNYCDNATYQNTGVGPTVKAVSVCYEDGGVYFTDSDGAILTSGKAGLGLASTPSVRWRIPTVYDYLIADAHGLKFVLPDFTSGFEWTGTIYSAASVNAFGTNNTTAYTGISH